MGYISVYLYYDGNNTETDPVVAKAWIWTKTRNFELEKYEFSNGNKNGWNKNDIGWLNFRKQKDLIEKDCNEAGTLTITMYCGMDQASVLFLGVRVFSRTFFNARHRAKRRNGALLLR